MKYRLLVRTSSMCFLTSAEGVDKEGYIFAGRNLNFCIAPKKKLSGPEGNPPVFESNLLLSAESFTFGEVSPNPAIDPRVSKVISQLKEDGKSEFIKVDIKHQWSKLNEPKSTKLNIDLTGLQIVFDREVMKGFYKFLSDDIFTIAKEDQKRVKQLKQIKKLEKQAETPGTPTSVESEKPVEQQIEEIISKIKPTKMSDYFYWFNSSDVSITVNNTTFIIPKDYYVRADGIQLNRELRATASRVSFINLAQWDAVPRLADSLKVLEKSEMLTFAKDGSKKSNKFQVREVSHVRQHHFVNYYSDHFQR